MKDYLRRFFLLSLIGILVFCCGCATIQKAKRAEELEKELTQLNQLIKERENQIKEKDDQITRLQKLLDEKERKFKDDQISYKQTIEQLYKELEEYKAKLKEKEEIRKLK